MRQVALLGRRRHALDMHHVVLHPPSGDATDVHQLVQGSFQLLAEGADIRRAASALLPQELNSHRVGAGMAGEVQLEPAGQRLLLERATLLPLNLRKTALKQLDEVTRNLHGVLPAPQVASAGRNEGTPVNGFRFLTSGVSFLDRHGGRREVLEHQVKPVMLVATRMPPDQLQELMGRELDDIPLMYPTSNVHNPLENIEMGLGKLNAGEFLSVFSRIYDFFSLARHSLKSEHFRELLNRQFEMWRSITQIAPDSV